MQSSGARASAIMASGTLVSRILGFVKTFLITVAIGSAATMADVFQLANTLPNLIYVLIAGGVFNAVLVPQIIKASKSEDEGADYISRLLTLAVIALLVITANMVPMASCSWDQPGPMSRMMGPTHSSTAAV
ncbi:lipid II flippase MurJ, partial [Kocuria rhizophila]|uniref:lipid II flippase MurJ n=1 Tax=Kocuria rhizophila TaxID=72000 RepID=UPI002E104F8A